MSDEVSRKLLFGMMDLVDTNQEMLDIEKQNQIDSTVREALTPGFGPGQGVLRR
jgi:hypothetical protein